MAENRRKIIYGVLAGLCFAVILVTGFKDRIQEMLQANESGAQEEYYMVIMGDSVFGNVQDETSIPAKLETLLGEKVFNGALGGTCMGRLGTNSGKSNMRDALSMVSFSKAIVSGDFRLQENLKVTESGTKYFPETIAGLKEIDFSKVEILLIGHCVNDYHAGEVIASTGDPYDENTFTGALRSTVKMLQDAYPDLRIVLVTAPYTWYTEQNLTCEEYVLGGNVLEDYVNAELAVAEQLGVEIIDVYHDVYPHDTWEDWSRYSFDGLHPNETGRELLAQIIADYLKREEG